MLRSRNCHYCGRITERGWGGQFRREHEECIPKYEPVPPHHSMSNPYARLLHQKIYTPQLVTFAEWESVRAERRKAHPEGANLGLSDSVEPTGGSE